MPPGSPGPRPSVARFSNQLIAGAGGRPADLPSQLGLSDGIRDRDDTELARGRGTAVLPRARDRAYHLGADRQPRRWLRENHRLTFGTHGELIDLVDDVLAFRPASGPSTAWTRWQQGEAAGYFRDFPAAADSQVAFRVNQIGVYAAGSMAADAAT